MNDQVKQNDQTKQNDRTKQYDQAQRIIRIMQDKNMNPTRFAEEIGIQRAAMSHIKLGRNYPSADVLTKIVERFDDINPGWLLTGKEPMKLVSKHPDGVIDFNQAEKTDNQPRETVNLPQKSVNPSRETVNQTQKTVKPSRETVNLPRETVNQTQETVNQADEDRRVIEKEVIVYKDRQQKAINKIVVFFSDHTYDTFIP